MAKVLTDQEAYRLKHEHEQNGGHVMTTVNGKYLCNVLFDDTGDGGTVIRHDCEPTNNTLGTYTMTTYKKLPKVYFEEVERYRIAKAKAKEALDMATNIERMADCIANPYIRKEFQRNAEYLRYEAERLRTGSMHHVKATLTRLLQ